MSEPARIGLDHPAFRGRLRVPFQRTALQSYDYRRSQPARSIPPSRLPIVKPQPFVYPAPSRQQSTKVLQRELVLPPQNNAPVVKAHRYSRSQVTLASLACLVAMAGLAVSWQTVKTNRYATAQAAALSRRIDNNSQGDGLPSTTRPSSQAVSQYFVAPDLPRYLDIPKLKIHARVMQVGVTAAGALGAPSNVYDTAWYTGSSKPGQPGATLIDGHVSSWTTHGVFYNIKQLVAGDTIQVVRGDGIMLTYQVVKTQIYPSGNVNMQAAVTPVTAGKSGLNLITCTGQVKKATSEFNERLIVFAQQV